MTSGETDFPKYPDQVCWKLVWEIIDDDIKMHMISNVYVFPNSSTGKESACNAETLVQFLGWEDLLKG